MIASKTISISHSAYRNNKTMKCPLWSRPKKKPFAVEVNTCTNYSKSINQRRKTFKCKLIRKKNTWWSAFWFYIPNYQMTITIFTKVIAKIPETPSDCNRP